MLVNGGLELFQGLHGVVGSLPVNGKLQPAVGAFNAAGQQVRNGRGEIPVSYTHLAAAWGDMADNGIECSVVMEKTEFDARAAFPDFKLA